LDQAVAPAQPNDVDNLTIGVLHLGAKTRLLEEAGFLTLADVRDLDATLLSQIPSVGRRTVDEFVHNHNALLNAVDRDGSVNWEIYCAAVGIPLLPTRPPVNGGEFLAGLPSFFAALADALDDRILATILLDRISKPTTSQKTLEEIGAAAVPALTRERVRQKERKLLGQITGGLLNETYEGLGIHFHPGFAFWWRKAADALADVEEIDVENFVKLLSNVWSIPQAAVMKQLPALVAVVTGEPQMAPGFRAFTALDPRLFTEGSGELNNLPVLKLRMDKVAIRLAEAGMQRFGDVVHSFRSGDLERMGVAPVKRVTDHFNLVASCLNEGSVDWAGYRAILKLDCLPKTVPATPADFVRTLTQDTENLLRGHEVSVRAVEIFRRRTGKEARERMTLHQVGEELGTFASSIKREETILLAWLNDVLVGREFCSLHVWLDGTWLRWWDEASETFEQSRDDYDDFADSLAWRWRVSRQEMNAAAPTLWAVFTGYPDGRPPRSRSVIHLADADVGLGRIRLQGFRRVH
jgi:hypothetical protein